jgi:adenosylmethionine-8-amino-7-oxononanoate aminotransferase
MMMRGVVTRTRPALGDHPAQGDIVFFAPPLVVTEVEIDRLVSVARDAVDAVLGLSLRNGRSSAIQDNVAVA